MTEQTGPAIVPAELIELGGQYHLRLTRPATWNKRELLPIHDHIVKGTVLAKIMEEEPDAVDASAAV